MLLLLLVIYFVSYFVTAPAAALAAPAFVGHAHSPLPVTPSRLTPQPSSSSRNQLPSFLLAFLLSLPVILLSVRPTAKEGLSSLSSSLLPLVPSLLFYIILFSRLSE